ncbi:unnamed protein product [Brassicogethes aeneus]|nr:unnamed protein product [Brassicogethes aeneus]
MSTHCFPYRPYDYMYDPIFSVSGPTDHYKEAVKCKITTAKFQICPIFPNMFSDLRNYPRQKLVRRRSESIPLYVEPDNKPKMSTESFEVISSNVLGKDKCKFFKLPITNFPPRDILPYRTIAPFHIKKVPEKNEGKTQINVATNTVYSNAEAQTEPWEPPYKIIGEGEPEVLLLSFLKWGEGLPAGQHEIELIERARMKRAWEKAIKPNVADEQSMNQLKEYLEALELDEWAFREKEIQEIQDMRMELLQKMLEEVHENSKKRSQSKLNSIIERTIAEKNRKLEKLRNGAKRDLRKLGLAARGINQRYHKVNIIDEHVDFKSEIYAPMMRHGEHPKRWHKVIDENNKKYKAQFIGVEKISTLPTWIDKATKVTEREIDRKLPTRHICMRETKWTQPVLKELHEELKSMRVKEERRSCGLLKRIEVEQVLQYTSEAEAIPDEAESQYQAVVRLQSTIKGRATQVLIYEGRDRCRKLIETLRTSVGLLQSQKDEKLKTKLKVKSQQRQEFLKDYKLEQVKESLERLRGSSVGTLLDFLNKELRRLQCERKAHALCMSLERDLHTREAAEAGRRQRELRRRREHDEIFKQVVKIHQETVDMYLQDIIVEGMDFASQDEASCYIKAIARKIDLETEELYKL